MFAGQYSMPDDYMDSGGVSRSRRETGGGGSPSANVEFIHPKMRDEYEGEEEEDTENPFVWLTSYARVPVINHTCHHQLSSPNKRFPLSFSWTQSKTFVRPLKNIARPGARA